MTLESPSATVNASDEKVFIALLDVKNFESLMPENLTKFSIETENSFKFALKGTPEIGLRVFEKKPYSDIFFKSLDSGKLDFTLRFKISVISEAQSCVQIFFEGNFNPMMALMIKSPITALLRTLSQNIEQGKLF